MTGSLSPGMILLIYRRVEKVRKVLDYEAIGNSRDHGSTLTEIMRLLDFAVDLDVSEWNPQTARLFALDAAMATIRRDAAVLSDADRHNLTSYLQEAKGLVVADRDDELGFLQAAMETRLSIISPGERRQVWLTAIDSLIPSPYRAALVSTENAISLGNRGTLADLSTLLRDRLSAGPGEGPLLLEPIAQLQITA